MLLPIARKVAKFGRKVGKTSEFTWRYVLNFQPTVSYVGSRAKLSDEATRVLHCLNSDGVAITSVDALLGSKSCYPELVRAVDQLEVDKIAEIAAFRASMLSSDDGPNRKKYVVSLLSDARRLDPGEIYTRFALQDPIRQVVNAYYGMYVSLRFCNVWHNFVTQKPPCESQLWHRDPEDRFVIKVFVLMCDVDAGTGPFTYAAGSHPKGHLARHPAYLHKDGETPRSNDDQMAEVVSRDRWITGIGPRGTIIFADTRGYHKGGLSRERDRILYLCEFFSRGADPGGGISTALRL
jgi:hypothetical protein